MKASELTIGNYYLILYNSRLLVVYKRETNLVIIKFIRDCGPKFVSLLINNSEIELVEHMNTASLKFENIEHYIKSKYSEYLI